MRYATFAPKSRFNDAKSAISQPMKGNDQESDPDETMLPHHERYTTDRHGDTDEVAHELQEEKRELVHRPQSHNHSIRSCHCCTPDTGCGTIYTSDDRGIVYSKSLERHLYTKTGGDTDFTNVTSLRGVFITSVLSEDNSIYSVITFDQGGEWSRINKPENTECDSTAKDKARCSLHIHAQYSMSQNLAVPLPPMSESNAIGIVIAHGSVGDAVSIASPSVYLSDDGGYSWAQVLEGPHHYAILDSGGLIVAIQQSDEPVNTIKFSTDEGQCWLSYNFSNDPLMFTGLASEPGARSLNVTVWGYQPGLFHRIWMSYTIDFAALLKKSCEDDDYTTWLAHSTDVGAPSDGCVLGYKEHYQRLKKLSMCQNGRDYLVSRESVNCNCTLDDYMCDFGYFRKENESTCVEQPELQGHELDLCINGEEEKLTTNGYRKIPGDKCIGGISPVRQETDMKKKCTNDLSDSSTPGKTSKQASAIPLILSVVVVLLFVVAAAIFIIKKYVCGGRFLVHRYSVLRQNMDTHGDEHLDTNIGGPCQRSGYHDDSDEVRKGRSAGKRDSPTTAAAGIGTRGSAGTDGNQGKHRVTKRGPALSYPMFTLVTGIVGRWRAVCVTALQRPNSDAAAIRIVVGIAAASLSVTVPLRPLHIKRRCSDTDNDPDRCSVAVWSLESCHTDRSPATNDAALRSASLLSSCTGCEPESRAVTSPLCFPAHSQYRRRAEHSAGGQTAVDESTFTLSTCDRRDRVWRCRGERSAACNILQHDRFGSGSVMMWGGISLEGRTALHVLARGSLTAIRYRDEILRPLVRPYAGAVGPGFLLMQDNARPHVAGLCQQFLQDEGIEAMDWPARSPDLNRIEHIWNIMSSTIHQRHVAP
ncbi:unnamed protein product [Ranitomeya imitator]|uniref:VPS10 domain-containing protein n=1 Tax=Ranitomeya imitator TaxID=111125 RepID=A0ABN9L3B3_9NEOB|nr:unnamed protein product [Ranitomeya imitator]